MTLEEAALQFLAQPRIAVVGVSRQPKEAANFVFRKLRAAGHTVVPVNPSATELEGSPCYPNVCSIPGGVSAAVIFTPPSAAEGVVRDCAAAGVRYVWLHRSIGQGSASDAAVAAARAAHLTLIPSGCPAMFSPPVDFGHKCMKWCLRAGGRLPKHVEA